jgi:hypothetical protein
MSGLDWDQKLVSAWLDGVKPQKLVSALLDWPYQLILAWLEIVVFDVF